jgi:hypothetical protein
LACEGMYADQETLNLPPTEATFPEERFSEGPELEDWSVFTFWACLVPPCPNRVE